MAAGAYAYWLDARRRFAEGRNDPAPVLQAALLGAIPELSSVGSASEMPTVDEPNSVAAESYLPAFTGMIVLCIVAAACIALIGRLAQPRSVGGAAVA